MRQAKVLLELLEQENKRRSKLQDKYNWKLCARDNQQMPEEWNTWLILAGRGFGKTRTGAETIRQCVKDGFRRICLIGNTLQDVEHVMIHGESGLMNVSPRHERPRYYASKSLLTWNNGAQAVCLSACASEQIRGQQFDLVWLDELCKFSNPDEVFNQLNLALRLTSANGEQPRMIITTTPKPMKLMKELVNDESVYKTYGSTFENKENLSSHFLKTVENKFGESRFGQQELYGEILDESGDFCPRECIQYKSFDYKQCKQIVVAVDPALGGKGDETGVVVVGELADDKYVVLEDASGKYKSSLWPEIVVNLYKKYDANGIVAEINQGGDMVETLLRQVDENIIVHKVYASKNKIVRAEPIVVMYEKMQVYHNNIFEKLEEQMMTSKHAHSPDRLDALVWGLTHLTKNKHSTDMWSGFVV